MSKLHVIGVGGTGHKVVNAVIHLAACGAFKGKLGPNEINEIHILTIDADDANGNLTQTKNTLAAYRSFYDALNDAGSLGLVKIDPVNEKVNIPLYQEDKKSLSKMFNIPQYDGSDVDAFIRFLYTQNEIETEFNQGFYGHTSIGTLVVNDILKNNEIWAEQIAKINENDFVVVIGSIFGGTGASAIPVLLDLLAAHKREVGFKLAALILNPYFQTVGNIKEEGLLNPDSSNFHIKAKASLYYYYRQEHYKKTNALYIIGESESNFSFEAFCRGSANQRNKAHPVELFAGTAIIDFIRESPDRQDEKIITAQRAEKDGSYCYTWPMLQNILPDLPVNIQNMIKAAIFYNKVIYGQLAHGNAASTWQKFYDPELDQKRDNKQMLVYENIHTYLKLLVNWFYDLHKRNDKQIDQNTGAPTWTEDARVKLFNVNDKNLFDDSPVVGGIITNFENLVYGVTNGNKSEKINFYLADRTPKDGKGFGALFANLLSFVGEQKKSFLGFGKKPPEQENFAFVPYLSRENNVTFNIPAASNKLWSKSEPNLLLSVAEGLPSTVSESFTKNDISIPSPWSIFITNELTLTEAKFAAINKAAFKEWCGIIALLVLRKINRYENAGLKLEDMKLDEGDGKFLDAVNVTLTPGSYIFDNPNWIKCHRLTLDGVTIAFLAHNTLVCPVYGLDIITKGKLNKIAPTIVNEKGLFLSPDNYFKDQSQSLNRDAKYALKLFLTELKTIITREAVKNQSEIIKSMQNLTDRYIDAISAVKPNPNLSIDPGKKDAVRSAASLFEELCIAPSNENVVLPFIMEGAKEYAALIGLNICGISAASPEAAHHLVTPGLVFNQITVANIGEYRGVLRDGIKLFYAEELLSDSMIMIKKDGGEDVFHAMPNPSSRLYEFEIIWPLNDVLLDLYSPEELNKMVSLVADTEKVTVSLKVKLRIGYHIISKEYRIKNRSETAEVAAGLNGICYIMEKNLIPFWSIWPYAKINDTQGVNTWQRYNCFCIEPNYRGIPVLEIKPVFKESGSHSAEERPLSTLHTVTEKFYYRRYAHLPAAFKVNEKTDAAPVYRGMIFMAEPKPVPAGAVNWNVGIDFGTTSTTAFYTSAGDSTARFIHLTNEYYWVEGMTEPKKEEYNNDLVTLCDNGYKNHEFYFIDDQSFKQNGYTTALEVMDISAANAAATLFDTHRIFWHNHKNFTILNTQQGREERLLTNIKWESEKSNSARYLNQLLTQIVYHAAEKGVRSINLFFSYPTAFGPDAKNQFCERVKDIIVALASQSGLDLTFNQAHNLLTESIAAAYYFSSKNARQKLIFCVDIGGGSTDASIWIEEKNIFQTSIHYASRDMFISALISLINIPTVLKAVTTESTEDGIHQMLYDRTLIIDNANNGKREIKKLEKLNDEQFNFLIETVLFEYYKKLKYRLENLKGQDKKEFTKFKYCLFIAYSGLVYYLACIIASLFTNTDDKRKINNDIPELVLGLSGKGSKLTEWIACDIIYNEAEKLIEEKTGLAIKITPKFTPETAKTETAIGMICNLDASGRQKNQSALIDPDIFMGCAITVDNGSEKRILAEDSFIDNYSDPFFANPASLKVEFDKDLKELSKFIAFINKISAKSRGDYPPIDSEAFNASKKNLWSKIDKGAKNVLKEGRFEPPFILMLKVFLDEYVKYIGDTYGKN
ncbi:MAG: hypothetical protein LBJ35_06305 [Spirochaetaceae bacterium]|jgi:hypothetical protein|nr:hypothetical protein [Spirochaetaceae bacterium]